MVTRGRGPVPDGCEALRADRGDAASLELVLAGRRFDFTVDFLAFDAPDIERLLLVPHTVLGRYVMISTGQVYLVTEGARPPFREEDANRPPIHEPRPGTRAHANWVYGTGKRRAEAALAVLRRTHGVRGIALRLPVVQGGRDHTGRLWAYVERMRDGGPVLVPGALDQPLRFVWTEDVARALVRLAANWPAGPMAYNLAQADLFDFRTFLRKLGAHLGVEPTVVPCAPEELEPAGLDEDVSPYSGRWCSVPDPSLAVASWGFEPSSSDEWMPRVVRELDAWDARPSHPGYSKREIELAWARGRRASVLA